jgi:glutamyl-tRNA reductase
MDEIALIGLNHTTASLDVRECLAFGADEGRTALAALQKLPGLRETLLLSTCNRVEVLFVADDPAVATAVKTALARAKALPLDRFESSLYHYRGQEAVRHLFAVAASLDSMIVGEPQILGQIKDAYLQATRQKTSGVVLNRLLHRTFSVAKRVRSETGIGDHAVSISYAAVELARKIFGRLEAKQVLLIGAGEMAELAVEHLMRQAIAKIWVANRTLERGVELAQRFNGQAIAFDEIQDHLDRVDIVISSTGAPDLVIHRAHIKAVLRRRRNRPLFFIDIAVPRDIDPAINRLGNTYVYDIDDLKNVIEENIEERRREAARAERMIDEAVISFRRWYESLDVVPTVKALRRKMERIVQAELRRTLSGLPHLTAADRQALTRMAAAIVNKVLHDPTLYLKRDGCRGDPSLIVDAARKLFRLDEPDPALSPDPPDTRIHPPARDADTPRCAAGSTLRR